MSGIKKNFIYQTFWQLLIMLLPLATSPFLARIFGAEGVGIYGYTSSIVAYFIMFSNLGIDKYGKREIGRLQHNREKRSRVFSEVFILHIIISLLIILIYIIYVLHFAEYKLYAMIQLLMVISSLLSFSWLFSGMEDFKKIVTRDTIIKVSTVILMFVLLRTANDLWIYVTIMSVGSFVSTIVFWIYRKEHVDFILPKIKSIFSHLPHLFILFMPVILESIYNIMGKIMLGYMDTVIAVGYYENARKALIARSLLFSLSWVLMPRMASLLEKKDYNSFNKYIKRSTEFVVIFSIAFAFGTAAVAKEFAPVFWGDEFETCGTLIMIMAFAIPFQGLIQMIREQYLIPNRRDKDYLVSAGVGAVINISLNILLIPNYSALGAAVSTLITEASVLILQIITIHKSLPILNYLKGKWIYLFPGIIMFIIIRLIGNLMGKYVLTLFFEVAIGGVVYMAFCIPYWMITKNENCLSILRGVISKIKK